MDYNDIVQPLGRNVAFSLEKNKLGLLISARIRSVDGKIVAEIIRNKWLINQNNYFRKNFDDHALEIIGQDGLVYLQIEYLDETTFRIGGAFFCESQNISDTDFDFPSVKNGMPEIGIVTMRWYNNHFR